MNEKMYMALAIGAGVGLLIALMSGSFYLGRRLAIKYLPNTGSKAHVFIGFVFMIFCFFVWGGLAELAK